MITRNCPFYNVEKRSQVKVKVRLRTVSKSACVNKFLSQYSFLEPTTICRISRLLENTA